MSDYKLAYVPTNRLVQRALVAAGAVVTGSDIDCNVQAFCDLVGQNPATEKIMKSFAPVTWTEVIQRSWRNNASLDPQPTLSNGQKRPEDQDPFTGLSLLELEHN